MKLSLAIEAKKLDLRLREKFIHEGKLNKSDLGKYLSDLEDDAANLTYTEAKSSTKSEDEPTATSMVEVNSQDPVA